MVHRLTWGLLAFLLVVGMFLAPYLWMTRGSPPLNDCRVVLGMSVVCLVLALACAGRAATGTVWGVLIDSRNRISLSRFQSALWTVVILGGFGAAVVSRILAGARLAPLDVEIPQELWWLMGISAASMVTSPVLKQAAREREDENAGSSAAQTATDHGIAVSDVQTVGSLVVNRSRNQAEWTDMIEGEQSTDFKSVDIGKLQMLVMTAVATIAYMSALFHLFENAGSTPIHELPIPTAGLSVLLGISHTGYLATKSIAKRG